MSVRGNMLEYTGINILLLSVVSWIAFTYLRPYLVKKGENLATKEDIATITREVESIRHKYLSDVEFIKAGLNEKLFVNQTRYQNEYHILTSLSEKIVELRDSVLALRPEFEYVDLNESEEERKRRKLRRYFDAGRELYLLFETKKPFFPDQIYKSVKEIDQVAWMEVVQFKNRNETMQIDLCYWEKSREHAEEIKTRAEQIMDLIRLRSKFWEDLGNNK
jgi:hypothetical protein